MAKVVYLSPTGSDSNNGLSPGAAKLTFSGTRAALAAGDLVSVAAGTYVTTASVTWSAATDSGVVYMADGSGPVIVNFNGTAAQFVSTQTGNSLYFVNIWFANSTSAFVTRGTSTAPSVIAINCVFFRNLNATPTGTGMQGQVGAINCTFFNLATGISLGGGVDAIGVPYNNYFKTVTSPFSGAAVHVRDYNAYSGNTEVRGINTAAANSDPGFVVNNITAAFPNFRLNPADTVAYTKFRTLGLRGSHIGSTGGVGPIYVSTIPQLRMITPDPTPTTGTWAAWEDDPSYVSGGTLGAIIQDATTGALVLDLATTPGATDGRVRSDVFDSGSARSWNLRGIMIQAATDIRHGSAIDTDTTLPIRYELRGSSSSFAKGDVSPTWEAVTRDQVFSRSYRYMQFRITFRRDHSNT